MDPKRLVTISKYLSRHLRHEPGRLGLSPDPGGWVAVDDLLAACARRSSALTREELEEALARDDKRRFSFDGTGTRIRADQGHSVEVELGLAPLDPPEGTGESPAPREAAPPDVRDFARRAAAAGAWAVV